MRQSQQPVPARVPDEPASYWQSTAAATLRSPGRLPTAAEVVVIGGGLLGTAAAYWLARAGATPVLLERGGLAAGATGRNGGFMVAGTAEPYPAAIARLGHTTAREIWQLTLDNRTLLRQVLAEESISCEYREPGSLHIALGEDQLARLASSAATLHADGFRAEMLDRHQLGQLIATPLGPEIGGGLLEPENGLLHSARLVHGLAAAAQRYDARIYVGTGVQRMEVNGSALDIHTTRGELRARAVIVAANAWLGELIPALAARITPVRGQVLACAPIRPIFEHGMGAALTPTGEYWQQTPDGTIVLGGCRAVAPGQDIGIRACTPTYEVQTELEQVLPRLFPELPRLQVAQRWAGPMAFTTDALPIADRVPERPSVWVVGGFCGHGMPFGLRLGQLLAQAATSDARPAALWPFRLERPTLA